MLSRIEPAQSVWKIIQARAGCLVGEVSALTAVPQVASNTPPSPLRMARQWHAGKRS